jgi:hypothetical protein
MTSLEAALILAVIVVVLLCIAGGMSAAKAAKRDRRTLEPKPQTPSSFEMDRAAEVQWRARVAANIQLREAKRLYARRNEALSEFENRRTQ